MRGIPQELFIVLIFGAVMLVQFLYKQLLKKAAAMQTETESGNVIQTTPVPLKADQTPIQEDTADALERIEAPQAASTAMVARALSSARPHPRRFSRRGLMPDQRAVQNAIVIAAILQPCHAHRPHDVG